MYDNKTKRRERRFMSPVLKIPVFQSHTVTLTFRNSRFRLGKLCRNLFDIHNSEMENV
jgi:hypothetical protein